MYISKVRVSEEFNNNNGRHLWIGCDVILSEGETEKDAVKKAMDFVLESNHGASEANDRLPVIQKEFSISQEDDAAFGQLKSALATFEFREDAQNHLDGTEFKFAFEAKQIVNSKPLKNKS